MILNYFSIKRTNKKKAQDERKSTIRENRINSSYGGKSILIYVLISNLVDLEWAEVVLGNGRQYIGVNMNRVKIHI